MTKLLIEIDGVTKDTADLTIPSDRKYREAWAFPTSGKAIIVDMPKARDIQRDHIRRDRKKQFPDLDAQWMIASELNDESKKEEIKLKKQKLRDAPADPRIEATTTPEELTKLTLEELIK